MLSEKILDKMEESNLDSILLLNPANITYLSGFKPSSFSILILKEEPTLLIPKLDLEESKKLSNINIEELKPLNVVLKMLKGKIGVERSMPASTYKKMTEYCDVKITDIIERCRMIKSTDEIHNIIKALKIAEDSIKEIDFSGNENYIAAQIEYNMKIRGSSKPSFDTMVASGKRSSFPHGTCSQKPVESPILLDWGAIYNNYASDTSRTIVETEKQEEILEIVIESQKEAIKNIAPGVKASYIDKVSRDIITEYGYGDNFIHSTGHGVGLDVHEGPSLSDKENSKLEKGMVVTVEPGIYLEDQFGVRIEDMVLVKRKAKVLNTLKSKINI